ncbi:hypothetical protein, partial [Paenibacillus xylanexedens]|uniref:hypothetical protein n=1 Tax=Paenibacillus xylanexedens TaxID=528191 RepID=UPI001C92D0CE
EAIRICLLNMAKRLKCRRGGGLMEWILVIFWGISVLGIIWRGVMRGEMVGVRMYWMRLWVVTVVVGGEVLEERCRVLNSF